MTTVGIYGTTGYAGQELTRLLAGHPEAEIRFVTSERSAGSRLRATAAGARVALLDKGQIIRVLASGLAIAWGVAGTDHDADIRNPRVDGLIENQLQRRFGLSLLVNDILQRQRILTWSGSRDYGLLDFHGRAKRPARNFL